MFSQTDIVQNIAITCSVYTSETPADMFREGMSLIDENMKVRKEQIGRRSFKKKCNIGTACRIYPLVFWNRLLSFIYWLVVSTSVFRTRYGSLFTQCCYNSLTLIRRDIVRNHFSSRNIFIQLLGSRTMITVFLAVFLRAVFQLLMFSSIRNESDFTQRNLKLFYLIG